MPEEYAHSEKAAIDRATGLRQYEGDEQIYENVLENFAHNSKDTLLRLKNALCADDTTLAHRVAHSLRGAAGIIGATGLADAASHVEKALLAAKSRPDFIEGEAFGEQMALLESEYNAVFDELKTIVKEKKVCRFGIMDRDKTARLIDGISPLLKTGNAKCLEYLDEIEESFRPAAEGFNLFITQVEQYDFELAFETLEGIHRFMGL